MLELVSVVTNSREVVMHSEIANHSLEKCNVTMVMRVCFKMISLCRVLGIDGFLHGD